jgi:hypothetical protein
METRFIILIFSVLLTSAHNSLRFNLVTNMQILTATKQDINMESMIGLVRRQQIQILLVKNDIPDYWNHTLYTTKTIMLSIGLSCVSSIFKRDQALAQQVTDNNTTPRLFVSTQLIIHLFPVADRNVFIILPTSPGY